MVGDTGRKIGGGKPVEKGRLRVEWGPEGGTICVTREAELLAPL
jgi:hypothetical protein